MCCAVLGSLALLAKRRRRRHADCKPSMPTAKGDGGDNSIRAGLISYDEIEICKREDGSDWVLGSGSFGKVYKGLRRGIQDVAIKKLSCDGTDHWLKQLEKETAVLERVSYDRNIVQYYGACFQNQSSAMLVMEYMAVRFYYLPLWAVSCPSGRHQL